MNRINLGIGIFNSLVIIIFFIYYFNKGKELVYVDSVQLLSNYKGMADAKKSFQQKAIVWQANIDTLSNELQRRINSYTKEKTHLTAKEKYLTEELIRTKQQQLNEYQEAISLKAQEENTEMSKRVLDEVNNYIRKMGEKRGYKIIFAATEYGNIAHADKAYDITDEVLAGINEAYTGK